MTENTWTYEGKIINDIKDFPEGTYGFVYQIIHTSTNKKYIGKKVLYFQRNVKIGKRETEKLRLERKEKGIPGRVPSKKLVVKESDWKDYYGSNKELAKLLSIEGPNNFNRKIIQFAPTKKLLTYYETKYLFMYEVLENDQYYNGDILGKFHKGDFPSNGGN